MTTGTLEPLLKLSKDIKDATITLSATEVRFLVDSYYQMQESRKRADNQVRSMAKVEEDEEVEPHEVIQWLADNNRSLENSIKNALHHYAKSKELGQWCLSITGIGPVITAGLLAHIDLEKAQTAGAIYRFAGIEPTVKWEKKTKRPWNASLKTLCWKIGESFMKVSTNENDFYGKYYVERKEFEMKKNTAGDYLAQALEKADKVAKTTSAWAWYNGCYKSEAVDLLIEGDVPPMQWAAKLKKYDAGVGMAMLPPGHITARAKRYATKLFLSHFHSVGRLMSGLPIVKPWIFSHGENAGHGQHVHYIAPPNYDMEKEIKSWELLKG